MKGNSMSIAQAGRWVIAAAVLAVAGCASVHQKEEAEKAVSSKTSDGWLQEFGVEKRSLATVGRNRYFILEPGFQVVLEGPDERVAITVLDETKRIGRVTTRVVEEREEQKGQLSEVSKNYFAICKETGDVFYFGEDVDVYKDGRIVRHSGQWRAYKNGARCGMMMPGTPTVGAKYYQEIAPGKAMDRAEIVGLNEALKTPAGSFSGCLKTLETSALSASEKEYKTYAPGIGIIQDEDLLLVRYGFVGK